MVEQEKMWQKDFEESLCARRSLLQIRSSFLEEWWIRRGLSLVVAMVLSAPSTSWSGEKWRGRELRRGSVKVRRCSWKMKRESVHATEDTASASISCWLRETCTGNVSGRQHQLVDMAIQNADEDLEEMWILRAGWVILKNTHELRDGQECSTLVKVVEGQKNVARGASAR